MDSVARVQEKEKKSLFQGSNRLKLIKANFSVLKKSITATLEHKVQQAGGARVPATYASACLHHIT